MKSIFVLSMLKSLPENKYFTHVRPLKKEEAVFNNNFVPIINFKSSRLPRKIFNKGAVA